MERHLYDFRFDAVLYENLFHFFQGNGSVAVNTGTSVDQLNKYFTITGMPVASSQYWNSVHGRGAGEAMQKLLISLIL